MTEQPRRFPPEYFRRYDEADDRLFYAEPRLVVHIDDHAIEAIGKHLDQWLPKDGVVLDLMSNWRSHLPDGFPKRKLVGLGLNDVEMSENPQLDERLVHDLSTDPVLPFQDASFDAAVLMVSVQYLVRPVEVFREVARVLKPGAWFHVIYSNRMFLTKAVAIWQSLSNAQRAQLIEAYFATSGGWEQPEVLDISPKMGFPPDPVYVVAARALG